MGSLSGASPCQSKSLAARGSDSRGAGAAVATHRLSDDLRARGTGALCRGIGRAIVDDDDLIDPLG